jgi:hypothetical protein
MIMAILVIAGLFFLFCLTLGLRTRQPMAFIAAFFVLGALCCWWGFLTSAMLTGSQLGAEIWLAASAVCLTLAGVLASTAWRRSSGSR